MTVLFYDKHKFKTLAVGGVATIVSDLAPSTPQGGRRAKVWICTDAAGHRVSFRQDRFEVRKIGG